MGFESVLSLYLRRHEYARRIREFEPPLFPGYLFCRSDPAVRLPILTTPGVLQMVGAGRTPIPIEDREITSLQKAAAAGVSMVPHPFWQSGQRGGIMTGTLVRLAGRVWSAK